MSSRVKSDRPIAAPVRTPRNRSFIFSMACLAGLAAQPAAGADLGGNCCADLEVRIAELEAATGSQGNQIISLGPGLSAVIIPNASGVVIEAGNKTVVLDPTSFAQEDNALRFIGTELLNILSNSLDGAPTGTPFSSPGPMRAGILSADTASEAGSEPSATASGWGAGFGGRARFDETQGSTQSDSTFGGGLGGAQFRFTPSITAGTFAGGAANTYETGNGKRIDTDYFLTGVYGRGFVGPVFIDISLTGGRTESDSARSFVTNQPGVLAAQTARAQYTGSFFMPAVRLGTAIPIGAGAVFLPAVEARYINQRFDSYRESGSVANLSVGSRELESFEERIQIGIRQTLGPALSLHAEGGAVFYQRTGDRDVDAGVFGQSFRFDPSAKANETGIFGRAGLSTAITNNTSVFGDVEVLHVQDVDVVSGSAGVRVKF